MGHCYGWQNRFQLLRVFSIRALSIWGGFLRPPHILELGSGQVGQLRIAGIKNRPR